MARKNRRVNNPKDNPKKKDLTVDESLLRSLVPTHEEALKKIAGKKYNIPTVLGMVAKSMSPKLELSALDQSLSNVGITTDRKRMYDRMQDVYKRIEKYGSEDLLKGFNNLKREDVYYIKYKYLNLKNKSRIEGAKMDWEYGALTARSKFVPKTHAKTVYQPPSKQNSMMRRQVKVLTPRFRK